MDEFKDMERKRPKVGALADLLAEVQRVIDQISVDKKPGTAIMGDLTKALDNISYGFDPVKLPEGGSKIPVVVNRQDVNALGAVAVPAVAAGAAVAANGVVPMGYYASREGEKFFADLAKTGGPKVNPFWSTK